jgi:lysophospholipase L1-like esterase
MAAQLSFEEFERKLSEGSLTESEYRRYLEIDPTATHVRVRFKPDALRDAPPPGYDIDEQVYLAERKQQDRQVDMLLLKDVPRVTADGDSWFKLPPVLCPPAIANQLKADKKRLNVDNLGHWGDTIETIARKKRYVDSIQKLKPAWFILSGGGNDVQEALKDRHLLEPYDPNRPVDQCISSSGHQVIARVGVTMRSILDEAVRLKPDVNIICYAYDFPRPELGEGEYIGRYLRAQHYPENTWRQIAHLLIDKLTGVVQATISALPNARFLDCRGVTARYEWWNDMHPEKDGFGALAHSYEQAMGVVLRIRARSTSVAANFKAKKANRKTKARTAKGTTRRKSPHSTPLQKKRRPVSRHK